MKHAFLAIALLLVPMLAHAAPPNGAAKLTKSYGDVHKVPWKKLAYRSSAGTYEKASRKGLISVEKVVYGDLDFDMKDEALVIITESDDPNVMGDEPMSYALVYGVVKGKVQLLGDVTPAEGGVGATDGEVGEDQDGGRWFEVDGLNEDGEQKSTAWSLDEHGKLVDHI